MAPDKAVVGLDTDTGEDAVCPRYPTAHDGVGAERERRGRQSCGSLEYHMGNHPEPPRHVWGRFGWTAAEPDLFAHAECFSKNVHKLSYTHTQYLQLLCEMTLATPASRVAVSMGMEPHEDIPDGTCQFLSSLGSSWGDSWEWPV